MKRIGFFHSQDLDGHCSGFLLKDHFKEDIELIGINYGDPFPWHRIDSQTEVWMADFSLQPFSDMERLAKQAKGFIWIDHHSSAIESYRGSSITLEGKRETYTAACELLWNYLYPEKEVPEAIALLARYDVWDHSDERAVFLNAGFSRYNTNPEDSNNLGIWRALKDFNSFRCNVIREGRVIIEYDQHLRDRTVLDNSFPTKFNDLRAIAVNTTFIGSPTFNKVWDPEKFDICLAFHILPSKNWRVRLYSPKEKVNVGNIAKDFGGGGHPDAAGFVCETLPFRTPVDK